MKKLKIFFVLICTIALLSVCRKPESFPQDQQDERLSGGKCTSFDNTSGAFQHPFDEMAGYDLAIHTRGDAVFSFTFVAAPAPVHSGLGPAYNNVSCISCHHNDGIGVPTTGEAQSSLLMRISLPGTDEHGGDLSVPGYGTQLQDKALYGKQPECKVNITYNEQQFSFPDGETYSLRSPTYTLTNLYVPISGTYMLSPRLAPPVFGLGLLEAISESDILANADEGDANGDGISGKANYVWNPVTNSTELGRFGLKANTASILTQVAAAFNNDMGITTTIFPKETVFGQSQMDNLNDDPELPDSLLNQVKFYVQSLAVPARRDVTDQQVQRGKQLFISTKCESCHKQTFTTKVDVAFKALSNQTIHPYTDLLLHDMGTGLADNRPDFLANGQEWRTTPLWGLGLKDKVNFPGYYLHDGRARNILEAIMWHGGEAQSSLNYFKQLSKSDRDAVMIFLTSL